MARAHQPGRDGQLIADFYLKRLGTSLNVHVKLRSSRGQRIHLFRNQLRLQHGHGGPDLEFQMIAQSGYGGGYCLKTPHGQYLQVNRHNGMITVGSSCHAEALFHSSPLPPWLEALPKPPPPKPHVPLPVIEKRYVMHISGPGYQNWLFTPGVYAKHNDMVALVKPRITVSAPRDKATRWTIGFIRNSPNTVVLQAQDGMYLCVLWDGSMHTTPRTLSWERFTIGYHPDGKVTFRSWQGKYLTISPAGLVVATATRITKRELWTLSDVAVPAVLHGNVLLRTVNNRGKPAERYVALIDGAWRIEQSKSKVMGERPTMIMPLFTKDGPRYAIKQGRTYLEITHTGAAVAKHTLSENGHYTMEHLGNGHFIIRTVHHGKKYVTFYKNRITLESQQKTQARIIITRRTSQRKHTFLAINSARKHYIRATPSRIDKLGLFPQTWVVKYIRDSSRGHRIVSIRTLWNQYLSIPSSGDVILRTQPDEIELIRRGNKKDHTYVLHGQKSGKYLHLTPSGRFVAKVEIVATPVEIRVADSGIASGWQIDTPLSGRIKKYRLVRTRAQSSDHTRQIDGLALQRINDGKFMGIKPNGEIIATPIITQHSTLLPIAIGNEKAYALRTYAGQWVHLSSDSSIRQVPTLGKDEIIKIAPHTPAVVKAIKKALAKPKPFVIPKKSAPVLPKGLERLDPETVAQLEAMLAKKGGPATVKALLSGKGQGGAVKALLGGKGAGVALKAIARAKAAGVPKSEIRAIARAAGIPKSAIRKLTKVVSPRGRGGDGDKSSRSSLLPGLDELRQLRSSALRNKLKKLQSRSSSLRIKVKKLQLQMKLAQEQIEKLSTKSFKMNSSDGIKKLKSQLKKMETRMKKWDQNRRQQAKKFKKMMETLRKKGGRGLRRALNKRKKSKKNKKRKKSKQLKKMLKTLRKKGGRGRRVCRRTSSGRRVCRTRRRRSSSSSRRSRRVCRRTSSGRRVCRRQRSRSRSRTRRSRRGRRVCRRTSSGRRVCRRVSSRRGKRFARRIRDRLRRFRRSRSGRGRKSRRLLKCRTNRYGRRVCARCRRNRSGRRVCHRCVRRDGRLMCRRIRSRSRGDRDRDRFSRSLRRTGRRLRDGTRRGYRGIKKRWNKWRSGSGSGDEKDEDDEEKSAKSRARDGARRRRGGDWDKDGDEDRSGSRSDRDGDDARDDDGVARRDRDDDGGVARRDRDRDDGDDRLSFRRGRGRGGIGVGRVGSVSSLSRRLLNNLKKIRASHKKLTDKIGSIKHKALSEASQLRAKLKNSNPQVIQAVDDHIKKVFADSHDTMNNIDNQIATTHITVAQNTPALNAAVDVAKITIKQNQEQIKQQQATAAANGQVMIPGNNPAPLPNTAQQKIDATKQTIPTVTTSKTGVVNQAASNGGVTPTSTSTTAKKSASSDSKTTNAALYAGIGVLGLIVLFLICWIVAGRKSRQAPYEYDGH